MNKLLHCYSIKMLLISFPTQYKVHPPWGRVIKTHQKPPAQQDHCLSLQPCWFQHTHTCQHRSSSCWRSSTCLLASENEGQEEEEEEKSGGGGWGKKEDKWKGIGNRILRHVRLERMHSIIFSVCHDRWLLCCLLHSVTTSLAPGLHHRAVFHCSLCNK